MHIEYNKSLLDYNTFHIDEKASEFSEINNEEELYELLDFVKKHPKEISFIGGGSNILLTQPIDRLVVHNKLKGIEICNETDDTSDVKCMSGENWHACVRWCIERKLGGIENLSLIPGTAGAAPIQNIGAYGTELKDTLLEVEAINIETLEKKVFTNAECNFGYRDSIFKTQFKNKYFIVSITLQLQKKPVFNIEYGDIKKTLLEEFNNEVSISNISDAVIKIRTSKLPDPDEIGNAGSFFKNPVTDNDHAARLKNIFPDMPCYKAANGMKIPAAWLIEQCNWKGFNAGNYGVHTKQALVLVNYNHAKGADILALSNRIITSVQRQFNITLEREVNIW